MKTPQFRFTTDPGSALLYYGDEFVAKFNTLHRRALACILAAHYEDFNGDYTAYDNFSREDLIAAMEHNRDRAVAANRLTTERSKERDEARVALAAASAVFDQITQSLTKERDDAGKELVELAEEIESTTVQLAQCEHKVEEEKQKYRAMISHIQGPHGYEIKEPGGYQFLIRIMEDGSGFVMSTRKSDPGEIYPCKEWREFQALMDERDAFTKHVGASTFQDAQDVLLRGKAQDMDVIQAQFDQVKSLAAERDSWEQATTRISGEYQEILKECRDATDVADLMHDEFERIVASLRSYSLECDENLRQEIIGLCERATSKIRQNVPVIIQRNEAQTELRKVKAELKKALKVID